MAQNKSAVYFTSSFRIFRAIRSFVTCPLKAHHTVKILAICQLSGNLIQTLFYRSRTLPQALSKYFIRGDIGHDSLTAVFSQVNTQKGSIDQGLTIRSDERLRLETSGFKLFTVANLRYQLS